MEFRTSPVGKIETDESTIAIVGQGRTAYVWIGIGGSVATLEGVATLRRFANEILSRLPVEARRGNVGK